MLRVFVVFGAGYLLSSALRGVTATLAPSFVQTFHLQPAQLGILGGMYFLGFALMQLPAGAWLDRFGSRPVLSVSLLLAALGSYLFATAESFAGLVVARFACGVGVSACLIAPLTSARLWLSPSLQQPVNIWMLMVGALGLLIATLPAQMVANLLGWRVVFMGTAAGFVLTVTAILAWVPGGAPSVCGSEPWFRSYAPILKSRHTWKMAPLGFFSYAILVAVQTLWAGPWLTDVSGVGVDGAAMGLFGINVVMLLVFLGLGFVMPRVVRSEAGAQGALRVGLPFSVGALLMIPIAGADAGWVHFSVYCVASAVLALAEHLGSSGRDALHLIQIRRVMHAFELLAGDPGRIDALPGAQQTGCGDAIEHRRQPRRCFRVTLAGLVTETIGVGQQYAVHAAGSGGQPVPGHIRREYVCKQAG